MSHVRNINPVSWGSLVIAVALCLQAAEPTDGKPAKPAAKPADNSYCFVCHVNFKNEELSKKHQATGIGCARCHGESDNHSADEDGLTPPEILYPADKINPACLKCHPVDSLVKREIHRPAVARDPDKKSLCTECHGQHRLSVRTRRWDKHTGKLVVDDGVRMMQTNSPARNAR
jgi:hypothetical protein